MTQKEKSIFFWLLRLSYTHYLPELTARENMGCIFLDLGGLSSNFQLLQMPLVSLLSSFDPFKLIGLLELCDKDR